ncbi:VWA-like domain-containing protein [uncultured Lamprocystis sp.]|uniref:vWA domain-containing protein n=1 Tax=uncultured Lamprocystis sp. TaxID=543132 RepID=UPI0025E8F50A|nr:VWA-like domain-containing protein [uncultured Lamprocystis sp.]
MPPTPIETKLAAARTRLILDKPFLGALVLRLPMHAAATDWCKTTATDARAFYYNPDYIAALTLDQTQFILAHEALHCALSHFARRRHRLRHRWDLACDYAVNPLLIADGLTPPPGALVMPMYKGMTAEEIYPLIGEQDQSETLDTHAYDQDDQNPRGRGQQSGLTEKDLDQRPPQQQPAAGEPDQGGARNAQPAPGGGAGAPQPLTPDEQDTLAVQWQQRLAGAAQQAMQAGKLGGELARMIDHLLQPQLPWRMLLARYLSATARDDFSYARPSRREGDFILPSLRSQQLDLIIAIDTSGSIKDQELEEFINEIDALKGQVRARVTLLPCDAALCAGAPFRYEPWEQVVRPTAIQGGGGTSFVPVFRWVATAGIQPDLLVYFTDAEGEFPKQEPPYPVIWLVKGQSKVPWGQRIQLN